MERFLAFTWSLGMLLGGILEHFWWFGGLFLVFLERTIVDVALACMLTPTCVFTSVFRYLLPWVWVSAWSSPASFMGHFPEVMSQVVGIRESSARVARAKILVYIHIYIYNWGAISRAQGSKTANPPGSPQRQKSLF